jgi:hypothetical protein
MSTPATIERLLVMWTHYGQLTRDQVAEVVQHFTAGGAS